MGHLARWLTFALFSVFMGSILGCKEKEPDPLRHKVTRPKLPEMSK